MNNLTFPILLLSILCFSSCRSWHMNEYYSIYNGIHRSFDINARKYKDNENRRYSLELYGNNTFTMSDITDQRIWESGRGRWHDCGDYIILEFDEYRQDREQEKLEESLSGTIFIHNVCMVLKKKGKQDLRLLPSRALLRLGN